MRAEQELVAAMAAGHRDAFAQLYDLHVGGAARAALELGVARADLEPMLQRVFLDLWVTAPRMDPSVPVAEQLLALAVLHARPLPSMPEAA